VAIDGDTLVIGDPNAGNSGRVFVYKLNSTTNTWSLANSIDISTHVSGWGTTVRIGPVGDASSIIGGSQWIAVSGNHIAVGAPSENSNNGRIAWIADTSGGGWSTVATGLMDEPGGYNDDTSALYYGASVAIAGDTLVVGEPGADTNGSGLYGGNGSGQGIVSIYNWSTGSTSAPTATPALILTGGTTNGYFGAAVDAEIFSNTYRIVVGAPAENTSGRAYIYEGASNASLTTTTLATQTTGNAAHRFGIAVAVNQARVAVGSSAPANFGATTNTAVYYYEPSTANDFPGGTTFTSTANGLTGSIYRYAWTVGANTSAAVDDRFGRSVAITNQNVVLAGAPLYGTDNRGTVAVFYARTPVAVADSVSVTESASSVISILSNDIFGTEVSTTVPVTILDGAGGTPNTKVGDGTWTWNSGTRQLTYNTNGKYEYLAVGESTTASINYRLDAQLGGVTFSTIGKVTVTITGQNDAPVLNAGIPNITAPRRNEPQATPAGPLAYSTGTVEIPISAFDDVDATNTLTYSLVSTAKLSGDASLPASLAAGVVTIGGSYNMGTGVNTGSISYNFSTLTNTLYQNTSWTVTVRASDGTATTDTTFILYIGRDNENPALVGVGVPDFGDNSPVGDIVNEDSVFTQSLTSYFTDPDPTTGQYAESLTYSIISQTGPGPDWLAISASGSLSGVANNDNVGTHTVVVRATDVFGNYIQDTFTVRITNTNDAPVLTNEIDRKIAIKGETWSFNVTTGQVAWNGTNQTIDDAGPYFTDVDNSTADGRTPSSGDVITYRAYDATSGQEITSGAGSTNAPWLRFNGTSFSSSGTVTNALGTILTIRLDAVDRIGGAAGPIGGTTSHLFEIGVFPRDGGAAISTALPAAASGGRLGFDVAINSDNGRWAVVGQPGANTGDGQVLIYQNTNFASTTTAPSWTLVSTLTPTAASDGRFGSAVDISADGRYIVVGAPRDTAGAGAVYFYTNTTQGATSATPGSWVASVGTPKATAPAGDNNADDRFGSAVAINENGGFVVVGAPLDDEAGTNAGAAYMFGFNAAPAAGNKRLPTTDGGSDSRAGDMYGTSVAFDQNMFVVGAYRDDHSGKVDAGSAYVYSTDNTSFSKLKKASNVGNSDYFGWSLDVESFASRNSVVVAVGAYNDDTAADNAGAIYIFRSDTMTTDNADGNGVLGSLVQQSFITAYDATALDNFGFSVAVDVEGDALAGALRVASGGNINALQTGSVYAYRYWSGYGWTGQRYLAATDASTTNASNQFGYAVDIAGSRVIAGAPNAERSTTNVAGLYYSFGLGVTGSISAIETTPLSGNIAKEVGSSIPAPVSLGGGQQSTSTTLLDWKPLLSPVYNWSALSLDGKRSQDAQAKAFDSRYASREKAGKSSAGGDSIAEEMLFDLRTLTGKKLAKSLQQISVEGAHRDAVQKSEKQQGSEATQEQGVDGTGRPAETKAAPEKSKQDGASTVPQGLSSQLKAAQAAHVRKANDLVASLSTLTA
jgi:hypothetical protein